MLELHKKRLEVVKGVDLKHSFFACLAKALKDKFEGFMQGLFVI